MLGGAPAKRRHDITTISLSRLFKDDGSFDAGDFMSWNSGEDDPFVDIKRQSCPPSEPANAGPASNSVTVIAQTTTVGYVKPRSTTCATASCLNASENLFPVFIISSPCFQFVTSKASTFLGAPHSCRLIKISKVACVSWSSSHLPIHTAWLRCTSTTLHLPR